MDLLYHLVLTHYIITEADHSSVCRAVHSIERWTVFSGQLSVIQYFILQLYNIVSKMPRKCKNSADLFCYICGHYTTSDQKTVISSFVKRCYHAYFGCKLGDQDKPWAPHIVCKSCVENLRLWLKGKSKSLSFGVPMVWREPTNHGDDCYFCMTNMRGFSKKNKHKIVYPQCRSAILPAPHSEKIPVPIPPASLDELESSSESAKSPSEHDEDYTIEHDISPKLMLQEDLDDLVRDLNLPKESAELLGSRLQERNFLAPGTTFAWYRHREQEFVRFFSFQSSLVYCDNVEGLVSHMGKEYNAADWRLFIDSSKRTRDDGTSTCWRTTAGLFTDMIQMHSIEENQRKDNSIM